MPTGILELSSKILNIQTTDNVLSFYSNTGKVFDYLRNNNPCKSLEFVERNETFYILAKMRAFILGYDIDGYCQDIFNINNKKQYDKIMVTYPFAIHTRFLPSASKVEEDKI